VKPESSSGGRALDEPAARAWTRRGLWFGWAALAAGLTSLVAFTVAAVVVADRSADLETRGDRTRGVVESVDEAQAIVGPSIKVRFNDGSSDRTAVVHLNDNSPDYRSGDVVQVIFDPADTNRVSVAGEDNQSPWAVRVMIGLVVGGACLIGAGTALIWHWTGLRRLLRTGPWRSARFTLRVHSAGLAGNQCVLWIPDLTVHGEYLTEPLSPRRLDALALVHGGHLEYVGRPDRRILVRTPGSRAFIRCRFRKHSGR
jgi:hypothetical protein